MTRPDYERMRMQAREIADGAGVAVTWRHYVSGASGADQFGVSMTPCYVNTIVTALFNDGMPRHAWTPGGVLPTGQLHIALPVELGQYDRIIYAGSAWRVDGAVDRETFGAGQVQFNHPLVLASKTG